MTDNDTDPNQIGKQGKKKASMRESAAKSRAQAVKPRRVRKAASAATKPASKIKGALTQHFHVLPTSEDNFFTKPRRITPRYVVDSGRELKNVTWPGHKETWRLVFAVFVFAIVMGAVIASLDYVLERLLREVIL